MATKIGDLFFDVYADLTRANKSIEEYGKTVKGVATDAGRAIGETITNAVGLALGATTLLVVETLKVGSAYNVMGQSATTAFNSIYDDLRVANGLLQQISELDLETPFRGEALVRTARTLAGFGVAARDVDDLTFALSEATAAMGLGSDVLGRMALAFGQIQSRGKLAGDEARQLANYGIDAYGLLADKLGLTVAEVRELGEQSKLTADFVIPALIQSIEDRFGGATEALFNTAAGQAEGLRSVFEAVGSALVEPFIGFAGGGALVDAMSAIRLELIDLVSIADDGSFRLEGALSPLTGLMDGLAGSVTNLANQFAGFLGTLDSASLTNFVDQFEGLGPLIAALGAGVFTSLAQSIPIVGRLVAGINPLVAAAAALVAASPELRTEFADAFKAIWEAVKPLGPGVREVLVALTDIATGAVPHALDALVASIQALVPALDAALDAVNDLLPVLGPVLVAGVEALADAIQILADVLGVVPPEILVMAGAMYGLSVIFPTVTAAIALNTAVMAANGGAAALLATRYGFLATAIGVAAAAAGSYAGIKAGLTGDIDWLNRDVPIYEKPFQLAGRFGYALGGGDRQAAGEAQLYVESFNAAEQAASEFNLSLLEGVDNFSDAREAAMGWATQLGVSSDMAMHFANLVGLAWKEQYDSDQAALARQREIIRGYQWQENAYLEFQEQRAADSGAWQEELEEEIDLMGNLTEAANIAWQAVEQLNSAGADGELTEFLSGLQPLAESLTDALAEVPGALRDLNIDAALNDVSSSARAVVQSLAQDFGMSLDEIRASLDQRGLAAVIEALGQVTAETVEEVDPLIAKYSELGATASELQDAIQQLETQRTAGLRAQIDQVSAALRDARNAADEAKAALERYFQGEGGGVQQAIDELVLSLPKVGDQIEAGLLQGGPLGEANVRQALTGIGEDLAAIFTAGVAEGLSPEEIIARLGPAYGAIAQEVSGAANRISSLDWTEGFTPQAATQIRTWLEGILDPGAISGLFSDLANTEGAIPGLEAQLEGLQAQLRLDVEFSPDQVQGAMNAIRETRVVTTPVITPEAAQMVYDEIQQVLDSEDLKAAVDQALITQEIMDAAKDAEEQIVLRLNSELQFDPLALQELAYGVSQVFGDEFSSYLREKLRSEWNVSDIPVQPDTFSAEDMLRRAGELGITDGGGSSVVINNDIVVNESGGPRQTASEIVAASSAAAGSGGRYDPSRWSAIKRAV